MYHRCTLLACVAMYAMGTPVMQQKDITKLVEGGKKARTGERSRRCTGFCSIMARPATA